MLLVILTLTGMMWIVIGINENSKLIEYLQLDMPHPNKELSYILAAILGPITKLGAYWVKKTW